MDANKFEQLLSHASSLMNEDFDARVDSYSSTPGKKRGGGSSNEFSDLEAQVFGFTSSSNERRSPRGTGNSGSYNVNNLPEYMREEYIKNPPSSTNPLNEVHMPQITQTIPQSAGIDYNYIKYMIKEALQENSKQLNESGMSDFRGMRISGNKIQFIDNKGNLYEGVLTLKKRAN